MTSCTSNADAIWHSQVQDNGKRRLCQVLCSNVTDMHGPTIAISVSLLFLVLLCVQDHVL